jgi:hypothetical protein
MLIMFEPMATWVEVWPFAADKRGIWLVSGVGAWHPGTYVPADSSPHGEVELLLAENGALTEARFIHGSSWRHEAPRQIDTFIVVLDLGDEYVRARWPQAAPVDEMLPFEVGKPLDHLPDEPPTPRPVDVLLHGLRLLRHESESNSTTRATLAGLSGDWLRHLQAFAPALAKMYMYTAA